MPNLVSFFDIVRHCSFAYLKEVSSITETKVDSMLFFSEVKRAGYSKIEEPMILREKRDAPARYMVT